LTWDDDWNLGGCVKGRQIDVELVVFYDMAPQLPNRDSALPTDTQPFAVSDQRFMMQAFGVPPITRDVGYALIDGNRSDLAA